MGPLTGSGMFSGLLQDNSAQQTFTYAIRGGGSIFLRVLQTSAPAPEPSEVGTLALLTLGLNDRGLKP